MFPAASSTKYWHNRLARVVFVSAPCASLRETFLTCQQGASMTSPSISRREFVKSTAAAAGTLAAVNLATAKVLGANDRINMGVIGVGGMGTGHVGSLVKRGDKDNVKVLAGCDGHQ